MGPRMAYRRLKPQIFRQSGLIARCPNSPCGGPKPRSNFRVLGLVVAPQEPMKIHSEGNWCECQAFLWRQGPPVAPMIPTFKTSQSEVQRLCSTSPQPPQLHYCQQEWLWVFSWSLTQSDIENISNYFQSPSSDFFHTQKIGGRSQKVSGLKSD